MESVGGKLQGGPCFTARTKTSDGPKGWGKNETITRKVLRECTRPVLNTIAKGKLPSYYNTINTIFIQMDKNGLFPDSWKHLSKKKQWKHFFKYAIFSLWSFPVDLNCSRFLVKLFPSLNSNHQEHKQPFSLISAAPRPPPPPILRSSKGLKVVLLPGILPVTNFPNCENYKWKKSNTQKSMLTIWRRD